MQQSSQNKSLTSLHRHGKYMRHATEARRNSMTGRKTELKIGGRPRPARNREQQIHEVREMKTKASAENSSRT
jgi:hypothetical protein